MWSHLLIFPKYGDRMFFGSSKCIPNLSRSRMAIALKLRSAPIVDSIGCDGVNAIPKRRGNSEESKTCLIEAEPFIRLKLLPDELTIKRCKFHNLFKMPVVSQKSEARLDGALSNINVRKRRRKASAANLISQFSNIYPIGIQYIK